jgi:hypothetical protein
VRTPLVCEDPTDLPAGFDVLCLESLRVSLYGTQGVQCECTLSGRSSDESCLLGSMCYPAEGPDQHRMWFHSLEVVCLKYTYVAVALPAA